MSYRRTILALTFALPVLVFAQEICEPIYTVPKIMHVSSVGGQGSQVGAEMLDNGTGKTIHLIAGQPFIGNVIGNASVKDSIALGFFSYNIREPIPPTMRSSDGDYQNKILVEWDLNDGYTGPPVTSENIILYRNGNALTTLDISVSEYQDFNVFAGVDYEYEAVVSNSRGFSKDGGDYGFLNPNGIITGQVVTTNGNPVQFTKVVVTPNLGLSAKFNGDGYIFWYDSDIDGNRQFSGFEENYTIETWFRSVTLNDMTIFAAVDSASTIHYVDIKQNELGQILWTHSPLGGSSTTITSTDPYAGPGEIYHHLALVYNDGVMSMYIDGYIVGSATNASPIGDKAEIVMGKKSPNEHEDYYNGYLDDFRIWSKAKNWEDIRLYNKITLSGEEDSLAGYWKFDESAGDAVFDLSVNANGVNNDNDGEVCLVDRSEIIADVFVGGLTDSIGNYVIKNINYGAGTSFTITPSLESIIGRSIELDGADDYVDFSSRRIDLTSGFTIESWFKTPGSANDMVLFSSRNPIDDTSQLIVSIGANASSLSIDFFNQSISTSKEINDNLWHHWSVTFDTLENTMTVYVDGDISNGSGSTISLNPDLISDISVVSEFRFGNGLTQTSSHFLGFIDEIRVWAGVRTIDQITGTMNQVLGGDETGLSSYWNFNESTGSTINDAGSNLATGELVGMVSGTESWSLDIPLEETYAHYYSPESRLATLNFSNTSVDLVNFTDESLLPVSGYVMYEGTACFIEGAEILVDGESQFPTIITDENGKFTVEVEPGNAGNLLTVNFNSHEFEPSFIELPMMTKPLSGQYFYDKTIRSASGIVAGGACQLPLPLDTGQQIEVTLSAINTCIEKIAVADSQGNWSVDSLPPGIYNISVYHPNPDIVFDADTLSLEHINRTKDFIYFSELQVEIVNGSTTFNDSLNTGSGDGIDSDALILSVSDLQNADAVVVQPYTYSFQYIVFEEYGDNVCEIDTFTVTAYDDITSSVDSADVAVAVGEEKLYLFTAVEPNMLTGGDNPYQNKIQISIRDSKDRVASVNYYAAVLGLKQVENSSFVLNGSQEPWYVLRVPPGDESFSFLSTETELCNTLSTEVGFSYSAGTEVSTTFGEISQYAIGFPPVIKVFELGAEQTVSGSLSLSSSVVSTTEKTECLSTSETFTVYGDGEIMGNDASVFIGGSRTYTYGIATMLNIESDEFVIDTTIAQSGSEIASTYMHSRFYIENVLMQDLQIIIAASDDVTAVSDAEEEYEFWVDLMEKDLDAIENATAASNLSLGGQDGVTTITFDAGVEYEYTASSSTTSANTFEVSVEVDNEIGFESSFDLGAIEIGYMVSRSINAGTTIAETEEETSALETGFLLSDDDPGDGFSVTVKMDPVWNMPVFVTNGGQSSCPWEEGTLKRQLANIAVEENLLTNIPPEEPAVFNVFLGNISENSEDESYYLTVDNNSNPHGLEITASGNDLAGGVLYGLTAGEQIEVSVLIDRGPELYEYNDIVLQLVPDCEFDEDNWINYDEVSVSVTYKEPCSESEVSFPENGWVVDASHSDGDILKVTVTDYDLDNDTFESLSLQYRGGGLGDWYTAETIEKSILDTLSSNYVIFNWNISPTIVADGSYELRSVISCTGDSYDGISQINTGLIDRNGPEELTATPADGILGADDLISLTMNETIDCDAISIGLGDVVLTDTETGDNIDFTLTCGDDIIILSPGVGDRFLENTTLRVDVNSILDIYGNDITEPITWEFYFNKNPVAWSGSDISNIIMYIDEEYSTTRNLSNSGGSSNSYYLFGGRDISETADIYPENTIDLPAWLEVSPVSGTLTADSEQEITIGLVEDLSFGEYSTTIYAGVNGVGDEDLDIYMRKLCYEPDWSINPTEFEYSMNMTAMLITQPSSVVRDTSADIYDMVGVFVRDELRGVARVEYLSELESLSNFHPYELFLTIFSNTTEQEDLSFKVWDASSCSMLGTIVEQYSFEVNQVLGSLTNPVNLTATSQIVTELGYPSGWSWLSINTVGDDMSVNTILADMSPAEGDILKDQSSFAIYDPTVGWFPSTFEVDPQQMYKLKLTDLDTLEMIGYAVDVELDTVKINTGWNWVGFTPQESYPVNDALESLDNVITGDLIKSQDAFAQFLENYGWFGSLTYMSPNDGYLLKSSNQDTLLYPFTIAGSSSSSSGDTLDIQAPIVNREAPSWNVNASQYSGSMSLVSNIIIFDSTSADTGDMIAAFIDGECRGVAFPQYIPPLNEYIFFLTIYGNESESQNVTFEYYHRVMDQVLYVPNQISYQDNAIIGDLNEPYVMDARTLAIGDPDYVPNVFSLAQNYPNPFNPVTRIGYGIKDQSNVTIDIFNVMGEKVTTIVDERKDPGYYFVDWNSRNKFGNSVSAGIYFYQIRAGDFVKVRKLVLLK